MYIIYLRQGCRGWRKYKELSNPKEVDLLVSKLVAEEEVVNSDITVKYVG